MKKDCIFCISHPPAQVDSVQDGLGGVLPLLFRLISLPAFSLLPCLAQLIGLFNLCLGMGGLILILLINVLLVM